MIYTAAQRVREKFDKFDLLRVRDLPFDEGDMQNIHAWMSAVTHWIEVQEEEAT
jgi:hypothetical protein